MYSDDFFDRIDAEIIRRNRIRKICNIFICMIVCVMGMAALIIKGKQYLDSSDPLYQMFGAFTANGTSFTVIVSFLLILINSYEIGHRTEVTKNWLYYLRLSSTASETIIMFTVMMTLLPFVPDAPSYDTIDARLTHIYAPLLTILSFLFNDPPIGRLKPRQVIRGMVQLFLYAVIMLTLFISGLVPWEDAEYEFLHNGPNLFMLIAISAIFVGGFFLTWLISRLNRKGYVLLYRGVCSAAKIEK